MVCQLNHWWNSFLTKTIDTKCETFHLTQETSNIAYTQEAWVCMAALYLNVLNPTYCF